MATHEFQCRVYYEDTDLAGVVYYANYLRFIERGRTEWLREAGVDQGRLKAETGIVFVVRRCLVDYLKPALFDDILTIETTIRQVKGASLVLDQTVRRADETLVTAEVLVAAMDSDGRPTRLPGEIRGRLAVT